MDQPISPISQPSEPVQQFPSQPTSPAHSRGPMIAAVVIGVLVLAGAVFAYTKLADTPTLTPSPSPSPTSEVTAGWKTYANAQYGLSFQYPPAFIQTPLADYDGEKVIVHFEAPTSSQGIAVSIQDATLDPAHVQGFYGPVIPTRVILGNQVAYGYFDGDAGCSGFVLLTPYQGKTLRISSGSCESDDNAPPSAVFGYPFSNPAITAFTQGFHFDHPVADFRDTATRPFLYYGPESTTLLSSYNPSTKQDRHNAFEHPQDSTDITLSPNASLVAYTQSQNDVTGYADIFLKNLITGQLVRLTEKNNISSYSPRFSADSQWVCYKRQVEGNTPPSPVEDWAISISGNSNTSKKVPENFCLANY